MIIDTHVHAGEYPLHFPPAFAAQMMEACGRPIEAMRTSIPQLLIEMDEANVAKVFLLAFDAERTVGAKVPNEYVAEICQAHPDRFIGFASVDAYNPEAATMLERAVTQLGLRGLKLAPPYLGLSPADPRWDPVYQVADLYNLPVLLHTGFTPIKEAAQRYFPPMLLGAVAEKFPRLRLIAAHLGTPWVGPCLDLLTRHANLYADLSIFGWYQPIEIVAKTLNEARRKGVMHRLLWGTDYPMCDFKPFLDRMERLSQDETLFPQSHPLTSAELAALLGGTAQQIIGIAE